MNRRTFLNPFAFFQTDMKVPSPTTVRTEALELTGNEPTRFYVSKGAPPADTVETKTGKIYDAVFFIDLDGTPKVKTSDGRIFSMLIR